MITFTSLDYIVFFLYFIAVIGIGFVVSRRNPGMESFLLAGRRLTLPLFVASLVSTWYGGIIGVGEISYSSGIYNWLTQGFFWYIAYVVFALFLAVRLQSSHQYTLPDQLEHFYGKTARKIGLVLNFFNVVPITYVLSLGVMLNVIFGISLPCGIVLGGVLSVIYTFFGGFKADVYTDALQFILMFIGVALIIPFSYMEFGGLTFLKSHVPASHFSLTGGMPLTEVFVWGFIAMTTLVDPNFYQRCYAAKDPGVAKKGILISILFWMIFDAITTFGGIYARAALPEIDPKLAFPLMAERVLPPFFKGVFFTGMLATIMSTVDSFCFVGATTISRDLYQCVLNPRASEKDVVRMTRVGIVLVCLIAVILGLVMSPSIKNIWKLFGSISASGMLVPLMIGFWYPGRKRHRAGVASMCGGLLAAAWFYIGDKFLNIAWCGAIEPLYPGIVASLICFCLFNRAREDLNHQPSDP